MVLGALSVGLVALVVGSQILIRRRGQAMTGTAVAKLPGAVGAQLGQSEKALVYFFSPTCSACRAITPKIRELQKTRTDVFAVDVTQDTELALALNVMATPSTVEVSHGLISGFHVGPVPASVFERFSA